MASLREMRKRISSVRSIRQITKAMKMVAAARLRRAQDAILSARPYARRIEEVLADLAVRIEPGKVPLLCPSKAEKILLVVITADKGLCGSFNTNILRQANRFLAAQTKPVEILAIGRKGRDHFARRGFVVRHGHTDVYRHLKFETAIEIRDEIVDPFLHGDIGSAYLLFNEFKSAMSQQVVCKKLLPFEAPPGHKNETDFEYEPSEEAVYSAILPQYFAIEVWNALLESYSAELGARMTSMESATKNANEMISRLTLVSNRIRQAGITREIAEIVGGAEALK